MIVQKSPSLDFNVYHDIILHVLHTDCERKALAWENECLFIGVFCLILYVKIKLNCKYELQELRALLFMNR